jgi:hypothetical protein
VRLGPRDGFDECDHEHDCGLHDDVNRPCADHDGPCHHDDSVWGSDAVRGDADGDRGRVPVALGEHQL